MTCQAVIRNNSGQLVTNHGVGIQVSIMQGSATGTAIYVKTRTTAVNANGLATIEIENNDWACCQNFTNGTVSYSSKVDRLNVRAVRPF